MPCIAAPPLPFPELPNPLTFGAPDPPDVPGTPGLCCKLHPFTPKPKPPPVSATIMAPLLVGLKASIALLQAYYDAIPLVCPRE